MSQRLCIPRNHGAIEIGIIIIIIIIIVASKMLQIDENGEFFCVLPTYVVVIIIDINK